MCNKLNFLYIALFSSAISYVPEYFNILFLYPIFWGYIILYIKNILSQKYCLPDWDDEIVRIIPKGFLLNIYITVFTKITEFIGFSDIFTPEIYNQSHNVQLGAVFIAQTLVFPLLFILLPFPIVQFVKEGKFSELMRYFKAVKIMSYVQKDYLLASFIGIGTTFLSFSMFLFLPKIVILAVVYLTIVYIAGLYTIIFIKGEKIFGEKNSKEYIEKRRVLRLAVRAGICPFCSGKLNSDAYCISCGKWVNTSGLGEIAILPKKLKKWNWGAFLMTWIWGIGNKSPLAFVRLIPIMYFIWPFFCGARGNRWAWENNEYESIDEFKKIQAAWVPWGIVLTILNIIISVIISVVFFFVVMTLINTMT